LVQAWGQRRWRIHTRSVSDDEFIPGLDLRILPDFVPEREWLLGPGDVLYLPPGVAHWGLAQGDCMTWSVGFRAPSWRELATAWSEYLIERRVPRTRYRDPGLQRQPHSAEIGPDALARVGDALKACLAMEASELRRWFGCFSTETKDHLQVYPPEQSMTVQALRTQLESDGMLRRNSYSRLAFSRGDAGTDYLFANGTCYALASELGGFLPALTRSRELPVDHLWDWLDRPACVELLCQLINAGHFTLEHE
jgi:50S ribosomal protein L16 3-hydroxylase